MNTEIESFLQKEQELDVLFPNRNTQIHKSCCNKCPSSKGHDPMTRDIKKENSKDKIVKEYLFVCAWRRSKLCKGICDLFEINQKFIDESTK